MGIANIMLMRITITALIKESFKLMRRSKARTSHNLSGMVGAGTFQLFHFGRGIDR